MTNLNFWKISGLKDNEKIDLLVCMDNRLSEDDVLNYFEKLLNVSKTELSVVFMNSVCWN